MIHKIILPKLAANMEKGVLGKWLKQPGDKVKKGEALFEISTDKAVFEVEAEESGILRKILVGAGKQVSILKVVGIIADAHEKLPPLKELRKSPFLAAKTQQKSDPEKLPQPDSGPVKKLLACPIKQESVREAQRIKASPRAKALARQYQISLNLIKGTGPGDRITENDVTEYLRTRQEKVLIIGGGKGAAVVMSILNYNNDKKVFGIVDDNSKLWGRKIMEAPVLGPIKAIDQLKNSFDVLIIAFSKNMSARKKIFLEYKDKGYKFINVIHPQALIENNVKLGEGNLIYAFVRIGPFSQVGNNNVISAFGNIEHHNQIGSHILFGPHCSTSGSVAIGNSCKFGTGIFIQDNIQIGSNVLVASGSIIINDLPANSILRAKISQKPTIK